MSTILDIVSMIIYTLNIHMDKKYTVALRAVRFNNNQMSQAELAERVGVSRQTIVAIERGNYHPSVALALRIANVFSLPVEKIFYLTDE